MTDADWVKLLFGPYRAPRLRRGRRATCLFRDCDVVVTRWTDARIPWPLAVPLGGTGRSSLLVNQTLAWAIRHESAAALRHWWSVSVGLVWRWRKTFGVTRTNNPGSLRLIQAAADRGATVVSWREWTEEEREARRRTAVEMNLGRNLQPGYHGPWWSPRELARLGTMADEDVARRVGRTVNAVRLKRERLGIPNPALRLQTWTPEEDQAIRALPPAEAARATGRSLSAVYGRRYELRLPDGRAGGKARG